jgi:hypothetical protein
MKKRWAKKETQIREEMRKKRDEEIKSKDKKQVEQIFSTQAASGVLTNELLYIMDHSSQLVYSSRRNWSHSHRDTRRNPSMITFTTGTSRFRASSQPASSASSSSS